jgi:hypothetical protein
MAVYDDRTLILVFATQILDGPLGICEPNQLITCFRILRSSSGVFLCIRCSGIHRGMGTHISKVKSVDLDVWTPEQMEVRSHISSCEFMFTLPTVDPEMGEPSIKSVLGSAFEGRTCSARTVRYKYLAPKLRHLIKLLPPQQIRILHTV